MTRLVVLVLVTGCGAKPAPEAASTTAESREEASGAPTVPVEVPPCEGPCAAAARQLFGPTPHRSNDGPPATPAERRAGFASLVDLCTGGDAGACAITSAVHATGSDAPAYRYRFSVPEIGVTRVECDLGPGSWLPLDGVVQPVGYFRERVHDACEVGGWVELTRADQPESIGLTIDFAESATGEQLTDIRGVGSEGFRKCLTDQWGSAKPSVLGVCTVELSLR